MRFILPLALFIGLCVFLFLGLGQDPQNVPSPFIGKVVPGFELESLEQPTVYVSTDQYSGNPYVINVWGSWCPACYDEHPLLLEYAAENSLPIVGLNWKDTRAEASQWLERLGDPYVANAFDPTGDAGIDLGVYGAPESFLISADGIVLYKHVGPLTRDVWEKHFLGGVTP
ncbi:MAG: DsbE family thiol:disulfide interchange protein [Gammaproteobacteria bacterium]